MIKLFVHLTILLTAFNSVWCKPDYVFKDSLGWFKVHLIPSTWEEAYLTCHYDGAVLASPLHYQLAEALLTEMTECNINQIFTGTHALYSKGDYFSAEGVPISDMPIIWQYNAGSTEDCATMFNANPYTMNIASCTEQNPYICYKKLEDNYTINECGTFDDEYHLDKRTGSCYKLHNEKHTWSRAFKICAAEGGYLVILNNEEEAQIVRGMFPDGGPKPNMWDSFHIGLKAWGNNDQTWITIHGEKINDVFHTWNPGQPDNYMNNQYCATLLRLGTMDDNSCEFRSKFVCEKNPNTTRFEYATSAIIQ